MRFLIRTLIVLFVLGIIGVAASYPVRGYLKSSNQPNWRQAEVTKGKIIFVKNSTGDIQPVETVQIGSFVSGPITDLYVDFNDRVTKDELLAEVDPRLPDADVRRQKAALKTQVAGVEQAQALLQQARNNEERARALQEENPEFISETEMDQYIFNTKSLEAQLSVAKASVEQAQAALENAEEYLKYTKITSPVEGIVIDRKIEPGQTLASQFQTPELFVIAVDMDKKMHVFASVDEADIGLIQQAKKDGQPVEFTVYAWPGEVFEGEIEQIRFSSTTTQNVVTYPVVVAAPNPEMKLLPGMTAEISFRVDERENVIKIPNAALRFFPTDSKLVRESDRKLLEGDLRTTEDDEDDTVETSLSAAEKADLKRRRNRKHVWVVDGEFLKAIEVNTGLRDSKYTEMVSGDLEVGQKLVVGINKK